MRCNFGWHNVGHVYLCRYKKHLFSSSTQLFCPNKKINCFSPASDERALRAHFTERKFAARLNSESHFCLPLPLFWCSCENDTIWLWNMKNRRLFFFRNSLGSLLCGVIHCRVNLRWIMLTASLPMPIPIVISSNILPPIPKSRSWRWRWFCLHFIRKFSKQSFDDH